MGKSSDIFLSDLFPMDRHDQSGLFGIPAFEVPPVSKRVVKFIDMIDMISEPNVCEGICVIHYVWRRLAKPLA